MASIRSRDTFSCLLLLRITLSPDHFGIEESAYTAPLATGAAFLAAAFFLGAAFFAAAFFFGAAFLAAAFFAAAFLLLFGIVFNIYAALVATCRGFGVQVSQPWSE
ncbi:hypothetical protein CK934_24420 [Chitinophaga sp. MD30]|nr:hypothetical protein CK934_24420 [Chitinophaga sp. MD30]